jgi:hypothetical protein
VIDGVVGGIRSDHLFVIVNIPVPRPIVTYPVIVCPYHELLCATTFTWFPLTTFTPVVPMRSNVAPEYTSNRPEVVTGANVIDAKTPVSIPAIIVELPVNTLTGTLVRLAKANEPVVGVVLNHLVVTVNPVFADQTVIDHVTVSLYHVLVRRFILIVSPLFTIHVSPTLTPLIVRYPVVLEPPVNVSVTGTAIFKTVAVYTLVAYQVFNCAAPLDAKFIHSGVLSRIANISAIYFVASYCDGICTSVFPLLYLTGIFCLYIFNPNS